MKRTHSVLVMLALAGCAHSGARQLVRLDDFLAFSNPAMCESAPEHTRFLRALFAGDANDGFRPGLVLAPEAIRGAFGPIEVKRHDSWWSVTVPASGTLFGLKLRQIAHALPEGGDPGDVTYSFEASLDDVARALRERGFPAKAGASVEMGPPDGYAYELSVTADPDRAGRTHFSCGYS